MRNEQQLVRGFLFLITTVALLTGVEPAAGREHRPVVNAKAAILVDRQTDVVLWQHNSDMPLPQASTTKVTTATLALQSGRLDEAFRVSRRAALEPPSKIRLRSGWTVKLRDLVYAIMLNSANDASVVIAEGLSGSVEAFAARMTTQAMALGATKTRFANPNGLPAKEHYSTVRDLALIFDHALDTPGFRDVVETKHLNIVPASGSKRRISLKTKNRLLSGYHVKVVGKTGWTRAAGKCFVGAGRVGDRELIVAVLGSSDLWGDVRRLLEFGFDGTPPPLPHRQMAQANKADVSRVGAGDADAATRFYVRLATFRSISRANELTRNVKRDGYPARVYRVRLKGRRYYRVSVGSYGSRRQAANVARQIERKHPRLATQLVSS